MTIFWRMATRGLGSGTPNVVAGLKTFNGSRYSDLSFDNPSKEGCAPNAVRSATQEGLRRDAISQVASLLKSSVADRPLATLRVEAVFLTMQGGELQTYINAIHPRATLANGKSAYDGYLLKAWLPQCASINARRLRRRMIRGALFERRMCR